MSEQTAPAVILAFSFVVYGRIQRLSGYRRSPGSPTPPAARRDIPSRLPYVQAVTMGRPACSPTSETYHYDEVLGAEPMSTGPLAS